MAMSIPLPESIRTLFAAFPLHTYPTIERTPSSTRDHVTLWILPPNRPEVSCLSGDVECLKWQAYLALKGVQHLKLRWDVQPEGALNGRLPNLYLPDNGGE